MVFCDIGVGFGLCLAGPAEGAELSGQRVGPSLTIANLSLGTPRISDLAFIDLLVTNRARHRNLFGFVFNADDALKVSKAAQGLGGEVARDEHAGQKCEPDHGRYPNVLLPGCRAR